MNTFYTEDPVKAASFISDGKLVVFPTETVYGLGAHAFNPKAVERIYQAKQRPPSNPLIVHLGVLMDIERVAREIPPLAKSLMESFFPGPLTIILPRHPSLPKIVSGGLDTVALRMPSLPLASKFLGAASGPVAAPSANISGRPSATTWKSAAEDLNHRVHCILYGPASIVGLESTVVDCTGNLPILLRPGAISAERLKTVIPEFSTKTSDEYRSPGMRYHHYAPAAKIQVIEHSIDAYPENHTGYIGLDSPPMFLKFKKCLIPANVEEYSHRLFEFFRECDRSGVKLIYCQIVDPAGLGRALMDRIVRAAKSTK